MLAKMEWLSRKLKVIAIAAIRERMSLTVSGL